MKLIPIIAVVLYMFVSSISDAKKRQRRIQEVENEIEEDDTEVECEVENTRTTQTHDRRESLLKQLTGQADTHCNTTRDRWESLLKQLTGQANASRGTTGNVEYRPAHNRRQDDKTDDHAAQAAAGLCERQNAPDESSDNGRIARMAQMPTYSLQNGNTTAQGDDGRDSETYSLQNGNTAATDKTRAAAKSERETESTEEGEHTLSQEFDLRRAVLYSEILKPKFDNFQD